MESCENLTTHKSLAAERVGTALKQKAQLAPSVIIMIIIQLPDTSLVAATYILLEKHKTKMGTLTQPPHHWGSAEPR